MTKLAENFESRLLRELQAVVAERPAPAATPARRERRLLPVAGAAVGVAAVAGATLLLVSDAGSPSAAYAVTRAPDGTVKVEIRSLRDAAGLQRKLRDAGVRADVNYLPLGKTCRQPRFSPARGRGPVSMGVRVRGDGTAAFTLSPRQLAADQTVVITSSVGPGARPASSLSLAMATGSVAPCVPVKDTRPLPPPPPSGEQKRRHGHVESFGTDRGFQQRGG